MLVTFRRDLLRARPEPRSMEQQEQWVSSVERQSELDSESSRTARILSRPEAALCHACGVGPAHKPQVVLRRIRPLEHVRAGRCATTGRTGSGLHGTTRAALRSIGSSRDSTEHLTGAGRGPDLVGPGRLTRYAMIGTTASADPRGIFLPAHHHWDGFRGKVVRHSTRRATRPFGGAARNPSGERARAAARCAGGLGSGRRPADQAEQWTRDAILPRVVRTRPFESLGLRPARGRRRDSNHAAAVFA